MNFAVDGTLYRAKDCAEAGKIAQLPSPECVLGRPLKHSNV